MPDIDLTQIMPVTDVTVARLTSPAAYDELATHIMATPIPAVPAADPAPPHHQRARRLRPAWRLAIAVPLAGHATWHAYRDIVVFPDEDPA